MNTYELGRLRALNLLKLAEPHVPPVPVSPSRPSDPSDPGLIAASAGVINRTIKAFGNAGVAASNGFMGGYNANPGGHTAARIGQGLAGVPLPFLQEFYESGGVSGLANTGAIALSAVGAKKMYDDWQKRKAHEQQFAYHGE